MHVPRLPAMQIPPRPVSHAPSSSACLIWSIPTTAVMGKDLCRRIERWLTKPLLLAGEAPFCEGAELLFSTSAAAMQSEGKHRDVSRNVMNPEEAHNMKGISMGNKDTGIF